MVAEQTQALALVQAQEVEQIRPPLLRPRLPHPRLNLPTSLWTDEQTAHSGHRRAQHG